MVDVLGKSGSGANSMRQSDWLISGCVSDTPAVVDVLGKSTSGANSMRQSD